MIVLKITTQIGAGVLRIGVEGKLAGPWVEELERAWHSAARLEAIASVRVDLSSATFIDETGKLLLKKMVREGVELTASGCLNRAIVEQILESEKEGSGRTES